jgi:hypothetical protein
VAHAAAPIVWVEVIPLVTQTGTQPLMGALSLVATSRSGPDGVVPAELTPRSYEPPGTISCRVVAVSSGEVIEELAITTPALSTANRNAGWSGEESDTWSLVWVATWRR